MSVSVPQPSDILTGRYRLDRTEPWKALLRRLRVANQFGFLPLFAPEDAGVEIARRALEAWLLEKGEKLFTLTIHPDDPPEIITGFLIEAMENPGSIHWVQASPLDPALVKEEQLAARWLHPVHALNARRNELQRALQAPLIFAGPEAFSPFLRDNAPDLWDIRGASFYLDPPEEIAAKGGRTSLIGEDFSIPGDPEFSLGLAKELEGDPERALERAALLSRAARQYVSAWNLPKALEAMLASHELIALDVTDGRILANSYDGLARIHHKLGNDIKAIELQEIALDITRNAPEKDSRELAARLANLAFLVTETGQYDRAESLFREGLSIGEKSLGANHPMNAVALGNLGVIIQDKGQNEAAEQLYCRALRISVEGLGEDNPIVAACLNNLGSVVRARGDYELAEKHYRRALGINERVVGKDDPETAITLNNLANLLEHTGENVEAEDLYRRSIAIVREKFGENHADLLYPSNNLAGLLRQRGAFTDALEVSRDALQILFLYRKKNRVGHLSEKTIVQNYAEIMQETGKTQKEIWAELGSMRQEAGL